MKKSALPFIIMVFLSLSLPNIDKPGLSIDEADEAIAGDSIFQSDPAFFREVPSGYFIKLFNKRIPIMLGPYTGRIHAYITFVFSSIFGMNIFSIRFAPIFMSSMALVFIYLFCNMWFGYPAAVLTALLTATNIFFVQYSRVGNYREEIFIISFFWAGLYLLSRFLRERRSFFLFLSVLIFSLGLCAKLTMLFYLAGLGIAFLILNKEFNILSTMNLKRIALALAAFFLGTSNLIVFNIIYKGESFKNLTNSLTHTSFNGYSNLAYSGNLRMRLRELVDLLKGNIFDRMDWGVTQKASVEQLAPLFVGLFFVSLIFLFVILFKNINKNVRQMILFLFVVYVTVFLLTPFTPVGPHPAHLLLLLPFPQIIMALLLGYVWAKLRNRIVASAIIFSFIFPTLLFHISMNAHFYEEMKRNGGYRRWSTAIYELSSYLEKEKISSPVVFGFGLKENIAFLSRYRARPLQLEENRSLEETKEAYERLFSKGEPVFFLTKNTEDYKPNLDFFMELARKDGKSKELHKVFYNRAGEPVYWLYKIN